MYVEKERESKAHVCIDTYIHTYTFYTHIHKEGPKLIRYTLTPYAHACIHYTHTCMGTSVRKQCMEGEYKKQTIYRYTRVCMYICVFMYVCI